MLQYSGEGAGRAFKLNIEKERYAWEGRLHRVVLILWLILMGPQQRKYYLRTSADLVLNIILLLRLNSPKKKKKLFILPLIHFQLRLVNCFIWTTWWQFNGAPATDALLVREKRLQWGKSNNRRRQISVCVMAGLQLNPPHTTQHNAIMQGWTNRTSDFTLNWHLMKLALPLPWVFWQDGRCPPPDTVKLAAFWCGARPISKAPLRRSGTLAHLRSKEPTPWHSGVTSSHTAEPALNRPVWKACTCPAATADDKTETLSMMEHCCYFSLDR